MKSLIVGAAGFVGGYLIESLQDDGENIYATKLSHETIPYKVHVIDLDITKFNDVFNVIATIKPDVLYHLAAQSSVKLSWSNPQLTIDINVKGALNIFEAVRSVCPTTRIVVIGSSEEYGDIDYNRSVSEYVEPKPENIYALTKYAQERIAKMYVKAYGLNFVMTRSFNHFGPRQSTQFVIADFCSQVARIEKHLQQPIIRVGNLSACRDFTDVRDVVRAYKCLARDGVAGEIYNVCSGSPIQIKKILELILSYSSEKIKIEVDKTKYRPIDISVISGDVTKIKELGWSPKILLQQTILDTLNYFREK